MKILTLCGSIALTMMCNTTLAQDHSASKMLVTDKSPKKIAQARKKISSEFLNAYKQEGEPKIAIFWNKKFDDQLSQWNATNRISKTGETNTDIKEKFEPNSSNDGYVRNTSGGSRIVEAKYIEEKIVAKNREGFGELNDFSFGGGFVQSMLESGVYLIDRDAIMRLMQRDSAKSSGAEMISDAKKIETDALLGYADLLAEIVFSKEFSASSPMNREFLVTVKEISTGRLITMFRSSAIPTNVNKFKANGSGGYDEINVSLKDGNFRPERAGEQLAYELMQKLLQVW
ncbi:hypothetical protein NBRC116592_05970 [Colwellia sp. KU-HH00111]|uniref:hypothetical protein n=1 Tax=Colwellia sp. KU-HH00111 TaxID=3127652 RepID=UPI00310BE077